MLSARELRRVPPELADISDEVSEVFAARARNAKFARGAKVFAPEQTMKPLYLLVSGAIRVQRRLSHSRTEVLSIVRSGVGNVLTTTCALSFGLPAAEGIAHTDVEIIVLPRDAFDDLMIISPAFRACLFNACARRIAEMTDVIEETMVRRVDTRVAETLIASPHLEDANIICQRLSVDLGTHPSVIAQHLDEFLRRGWVVERDGAIELAQRDTIKAFAQHRRAALQLT